MARTSFDSLPAEIVLLVNEILADAHSPSLLAFALSNKRYYSLAKPLLFRFFKFAVGSRRELIRDVQICEDILRRNECFSHVRIVAVTGQGPRGPSQDAPGQTLDPWRRLPLTIWEDGSMDEGIFATALRLASDDCRDMNDVYQIDPAWQPLADLMIQLPNLADLRWDCGTELPPVLLAVLHNRFPRSRLHISRFRLRTHYLPSLDPHELNLVTSPCLYTVCPSWDESWGGMDHQGQNPVNEIILHLATGIAPRLRRVFVRKSHIDLDPTRNTDLQVRSEQNVCSQGLVSRRSIDVLHIEPIEDDFNDIIQAWQRHIDFSKLKSFKIIPRFPQIQVSQECLQILSTSKFTNLTTLSLQLMCDVMQTEVWVTKRLCPHTYYEAADEMLRAMPPLTSLRLYGHLDRLNMDALLAHHGTKLIELGLEGPWADTLISSKCVIHAIAKNCPRVQTLAASVRRSKGDGMEAASYHVLGCLPQLTSLDLQLNANNPHLLALEDSDEDDTSDDEIDPTFDAFDRLSAEGLRNLSETTWVYARNGNYRDALINAALDETLARSIFATISSGKPPGSMPLRRLKVGVANETGLGANHNAQHVLRYLGSPWRVERAVRDDALGQLDVEHLGAKGLNRLKALQPELHAIFRRIWPVQETKPEDWHQRWREMPEDWSGTWHSFPLAKVSDRWISAGVGGDV